MRRIVKESLIRRKTIYILDKDIGNVKIKQNELCQKGYDVSEIYWTIKRGKRLYEFRAVEETVI